MHQGKTQISSSHSTSQLWGHEHTAHGHPSPQHGGPELSVSWSGSETRDCLFLLVCSLHKVLKAEQRLPQAGRAALPLALLGCSQGGEGPVGVTSILAK